MCGIGLLRREVPGRLERVRLPLSVGVDLVITLSAMESCLAWLSFGIEPSHFKAFAAEGGNADSGEGVALPLMSDL